LSSDKFESFEKLLLALSITQISKDDYADFPYFSMYLVLANSRIQKAMFSPSYPNVPMSINPKI